MRTTGRAAVTVAVAGLLSLPLMAARAAEAGDLDPSWGKGGVSEATSGRARTTAVDAAGNVYLAGLRDASGTSGQTIVRYGPTGSLDLSFGPIRLPSASWYSDPTLALQRTPGGQRLLALDGTQVYGFTGSGSPDTTFGQNGVVQTPALPGTSTSGVDLEVTADGGRILHLGHVQEFTGRIVGGPIPGSAGAVSWSSSAVVTAYDAQGAADRSFGVQGTWLLPGPGALGCTVWCSYAGARLVPEDLEVAADGSIYVAGHWELGKMVGPLDGSVPREAILVKLTPDGQLDGSFGEHGVLRGSALSTDLPPGTTGVASRVVAVVAQPGKGVVVALQHHYDNGYGWFGGPIGADVRRLLGDGSLDLSFGADGVSVQSGPTKYLDHLEIDGSGRIVAFQDSWDVDSPCGCPPGTVLRLTADGAPDAGFGSDGVIQTGEGAGIGTLDVTGRVYVPQSASRYSGPMHVSRYLAGPTEGTAPVTVVGTVTEHRTGTPIEGATVACGSYSAATSRQGDYSLTLPSGSYSCTASADGYRTEKATRNIEPGSGPFDYELRRQR